MINKLIISVAESLLMARWRQTLVAALGVTFSIAMFIALLSFMAGLNDLLDGLILNRTPHVRIFNEIKPSTIQPIEKDSALSNAYHFIHSIKSANSRQWLYNSGAIIQSLKKDDQVLGISPKLTAQVFFNDGSVEITGVINGIDVNAESKLFHFNDYIMAGSGADLTKIPNSIILGNELAGKLLANVGDVVVITTSKGEQFPLKVVGYFQSGLKELDRTQSYATVGMVQKILNKSNDYITEIQVKLKDVNQAPTLAKKFAKIYETDAEDIQTANMQFETGSSLRTLISYTVGIVLLIVAGFGIYNILNMMIYEKMDSIAILKATGFSGSDVNKIFSVIALSIGVFGGAVGLISGFGLCYIIEHIPFSTPSLPTIKTYPVHYNPAFYVIGIVFSLVTTYLAGWLPARKASKIDPVIIIRGK
ncbi:MAG TPA: FtsX-like permease family protein [Sediminibacterium sp.]|nr:FtsX-like permease family protein [Sediminibacterium sp.]